MEASNKYGEKTKAAMDREAHQIDLNPEIVLQDAGMQCISVFL